MFMKKIILIVALASLLISCAPERQSSDSVALFFPLYDITKNIAGDRMSVSSFIPAGVEPHSFDPSPSDLMSLSQAKVFVGTGIDFEGMEDRFEGKLNEAAVVVQSFDGVDFIYDVDNSTDPHVWVSPKNIIIIANNIMEGLKKADPSNANYYEHNLQNYLASIQQLDSDFTMGLSSCRKNKILTTHAAFSYLAKDYGFEQVPIYGLSPEAEPTPDQIIRLIEAAKANDLKYVFYEELVDPRVSQTIASEVGAKTLALNPAESGDNGESYISLMRENLANLRVALECQ